MPEFSLEAILSVHDAAHECQDAALHRYALGLMAEAKLAHIVLDELDQCCDESLPGQKEPAQSGAAEEVPAKEESSQDGPVRVGEYCRLGPLRWSGAYRFPLVAQRMVTGKRYQVHKAGKEIKAFLPGGRPVRDLLAAESFARLESPASAVWECVWDGTTAWLYDILYQDGVQTHALPLSERLALLRQPRYGPGIQPLSYSVVDSADGLSELGGGRWVVRWMHEKIYLPAPFWFVYDPCAVRPGQFFRLMRPAGGDAAWLLARMGEGRRLVVESCPDGIPCQWHVWEGGQQVRAYVDSSAINRASRLRQIADALRAIVRERSMAGMVVEGRLVWNDKKRLATALAANEDLSGEDVRLVVRDLLYHDNKDVHAMPLGERRRLLAAVCPEGEHVLLAEYRSVGTREEYEQAFESMGEGLLVAAEDSPYSLTGSGELRQAVPLPEADSQTPMVTPVAGSQADVSRIWFARGEEAVEQDSQTSAFVYQYRLHGVMLPESIARVREVLLAGNAASQAAWSDWELARVREPFDSLRERVAAADWDRRHGIVAAALDTSYPGALTEADLATVVRQCGVSAVLLLEAPPSRQWLLGITQENMGTALQVLDDERGTHFEFLQSDPMLEGDGQWLSALNPDRPTDDLSLVEEGEYRFEPPGGLGATMDSAVCFLLADSGSAVLGVQKDDFHELFLLLDRHERRSGRFVWARVMLDTGPAWLGRFPEQVPYLMRHDRDTEVEKAMRDNLSYIAWNPEAIRVLEKTKLRTMLPVNWESKLEPFEDSPRWPS